MLDVESVQAFLVIVEQESFTRAAHQLGTTQGALSVKLRRLEDRLGVRLIERTPRMVKLSPKGRDFLASARAFVQAHERAMAQLSPEPTRFALGVTHILAGQELPTLLSQIRAARPRLTLEVHIDTSGNLIEQLDRGVLDGVIGCSYADARSREFVGHEPVNWYAAKSFVHHAGEPLPIAVLTRTCQAHEVCVASLDRAGISWVETFVGGGAMAVAAAVHAGLGVAALPAGAAPADCDDVGERLQLPPQPPVEITLHSRKSDRRSRETLHAILDVLRVGVGR